MSNIRSALLIILLFAHIAVAHEGPPYPLFVDKKVDPYIISVWTDPDVGTGLFFVILTEPVNPPSDLRIQIGVQPVTGRLPEAFYNAEREQVQGQVQYRAEVQFDTEELWQVRVRLESAKGNAETVANVEVTPPGYGRWDLLVYLMPFLAIGLLWAIAMIRKIKQRQSAAH
ncbi:MAG TPA: hypothetical protein VFR78_15060 [Pyrinomonadaceae bacterium]|nr:hypothetical protein [Pyrinomonadaceae bacterium]